MTLIREPTREELGGAYFNTWCRMAVLYVIVAEYFEEWDWFIEMEERCMRAAIAADGVIELRDFVELFWAELPNAQWEVYTIVRNAMNLF
jgi:hypothetical protein